MWSSSFFSVYACTYGLKLFEFKSVLLNNKKKCRRIWDDEMQATAPATSVSHTLNLVHCSTCYCFDIVSTARNPSAKSHKKSFFSPLKPTFEVKVFNISWCCDFQLTVQAFFFCVSKQFKTIHSFRNLFCFWQNSIKSIENEESADFWIFNIVPTGNIEWSAGSNESNWHGWSKSCGDLQYYARHSGCGSAMVSISDGIYHPKSSSIAKCHLHLSTEQHSEFVLAIALNPNRCQS